MVDKSENINIFYSKWAQRRDIPIAILAWVVLLIVSLWGLHYVSGTILLFLFAAFFAYALVPTVKFLERFLPRFLAITLTYLVILTGLGILIYFVATTAVTQFTLLAHYAAVLLTPKSNGQQTLFVLTLEHFGISQEQINLVGQQVTQQAESLTSSIVPFLSSIFAFILDMLLVGVMSIYLLVDGTRIAQWLQDNTPHTQQKRIEFLIRTLERIVGGYIRGQVLLTFIIGLLVGIGMTLFHVPYAILLGVLAFLLEFIPILGTFISGAICVLLALTQGWLIATFVLIYFIVIHILEGDILGPRIIGKAINLDPLVSIIALLAGSELFGITGALFASPVAGVLQVLIVTLWSEWKATHTQLFTRSKK